MKHWSVFPSEGKNGDAYDQTRSVESSSQDGNFARSIALLAFRGDGAAKKRMGAEG
jgi:hypothetical protein